MKIIIIDSANNRKTLNVDESIIASTLKDKIKKDCNINGELELVYNGIILEENDDLFTLGVREGATINYTIQYKAG
jgi:hypothetical protein